jgi:hypothetical protein
MSKYTIYFSLSPDDGDFLLDYVNRRGISNTSGNMISINESCYSIVKTWIDLTLGRGKE